MNYPQQGPHRYPPQNPGHPPPQSPYPPHGYGPPPQGQYPPHGPGYPPQQDSGHYPPQGDYRGGDPGRRGGSDAVVNVVRVATGIIVGIFVLHILFTVFGANEGNGFVSVVYGLAQVFVLGLGDVFSPGDAVLGVVLNYGLAALIYLAIGKFVVTLLRR